MEMLPLHILMIVFVQWWLCSSRRFKFKLYLFHLMAQVLSFLASASAIQICFLLNQMIILILQLLLLSILLLLRLQINDPVNGAKDVLAAVSIDKTKFHKIDRTLLIIVKHIEDKPIVLDRMRNTRVLAAGNKLLKTQLPVEVLIYAPESLSVINEFLFNSVMHLFHELLDAVAFGIGKRTADSFELLMSSHLGLFFPHLLAFGVGEGLHCDCLSEVVRVVVVLRRQNGTVVENPFERLQFCEADEILILKAIILLVILRKVFRRR